MTTDRSTPGIELTAAQRGDFESQGYLIYKDDKVRELRERLTADLHALSLSVLRRAGVDPAVCDRLEAEGFRAMMAWCQRNEVDHQYTRVFYELYEASMELIAALNDPVLTGLARALGVRHPLPGTLPTIRIDRPRDERFLTTLHQDWWYSMLSPNAITFWLAVIPLTPEMGYLQVVPGSHRQGLVPFRQEEGKYTFSAMTDIDEDDYVPVALAEDEILVFNQFLLHRSAANEGDCPRVTLQVRYNDLHTMEPIVSSFTAVSSKYIREQQKTLLESFARTGTPDREP